jgi:hypothetical protein
VRIFVFVLVVLGMSLVPTLALGVEAKPKPSQAPIVFSDKVCPNATQSVRDFDAQTASPDTPVDVVIATGNRIIEVYRECVQEKLSNPTGQGAISALSIDVGIEGAHYGQVRQAQYYVVIGRLQRLLGNTNTARDDLQEALKLVKDTIEWRASSQSVSTSNNINRGGSSARSSYGSDYSNYRQGALDIQKDAQAELDLLPKALNSTPSLPNHGGGGPPPSPRS